jgi:hypothetical protein
MLFREIIVVYCENHTEHINTLCRQNAELFNVEAGGPYSYHCALEGSCSGLFVVLNFCKRENICTMALIFLTSWRRARLMELTRAQLVKSFSTLWNPKTYNHVHRSRPLDPVTILTSICLRTTFIWLFHSRLRLPSCIFHSGFTAKCLYMSVFPEERATLWPSGIITPDLTVE